MAHLFDVSSYFCPTSHAEFLTTVAELVASGETTLFSKRDWEFLEGMTGWEFFGGMHLLCELIVLLNVGHRDMMRLVATLVRLGGEDGASNQPNAAFRRWCLGDPSRVEAVIADARRGDSLALDHLCFALEAGDRASDAIAFLTDGPASKTRILAATALGRMKLDSEIAASAVHLLAQTSIETDDRQLQYNTALGCFSVLAKNPSLPREDADQALDKILIESSDEAHRLLCTLLRTHSDTLTQSEITSVLNSLENVDPKYHHIIGSIDSLVPAFTSNNHFDLICTLISELIKKSNGMLSFNVFPMFSQELLGGDSRRLSKLVISWLMDGDLFLCTSVAQLFNADRDSPRTLDLDPDDVPAPAMDQLFVCRKAVGFLFHTPVAVASVLVTILRHGDNSIARDVSALLYWPLLISFEGELRHYLKDVVEQGPDPVAAHINDLFAQKDNQVNGLLGMEELVELHPTERQRQISRDHEQQQMNQSMKGGMKGSLLHKIASVEHILYGAGSSSYIDDPSGETRRVDMQFDTHSFSFEVPALEILDPEGLQMMLWQFRHERRKAQ